MPAPDSLSTVFLANAVLFSALTWILEHPAQRRNLLPALLLNTAGVAICFLTAWPWLFALGWGFTLAPAFLPEVETPRTVRAVLVFSLICLMCGFALPGWGGLACLALAAFVRKGIFPFQSWLPLALETKRMGVFNLILNTHLGAYLLLRFVLPSIGDVQPEAIAFLSFMAMFTALYTSILAVVARRPRRILALLMVSHSAFVLAGIETRNAEGVTGALLVAPLVSLATTMMLMIQQALEDRTAAAALAPELSGLGAPAPRLAAFFFLAALALVGLPGTLAFVAEDLLFHGALTDHPLLGICLPLATSLNAVIVLRLAVNHFWGRTRRQAIPIADALPAQRFGLAVGTALLFLAGLAPNTFVSWHANAAAVLLNQLLAR